MWLRGRRRGPKEGSAGTRAGRAAAIPVMVLCGVMLAAHAPVLDAAKFTGFVVFGMTLPGLVLWRLIGAYRRNLVEDLAAGFAIGTSVQLIVYLASASVGWQQWSWVWAPVVLAIGSFDQDVRDRVWRRVEAPLSPLTAWLLAASCSVVLFAMYLKGPDRYAPAYVDPMRSSPDMAFHQALAASALNDVPIAPLWVSGEPMKYQTFFHQLTASISWATGIDLTNLIYALAWLPIALAGCALVFVLAQRFLAAPGVRTRTGTTWAGPLAVVLAGIGGTLQPLPDISLGRISMASNAYLSPTQNLGMMLALLLAVLAIDLLRNQPPRSRWILLILVALASSGAKATVLPLAICGFGLVVLVRVVGRRQTTRTAVIGAAAMLALFVGSVAVIFGGQSSGLQLKFAATFVQLQPYASLQRGTGLDRHAQLVSAATTLLAWGLAILGVLFLRHLWRDPPAIFLTGAATGGFAAAVLTSQPGISQLYFYQTAFPFLAVLSCLGLARLVHRLDDRRGALLVPVAAALGLGACALARIGSAGPAGVQGPVLWMLGALALAALVVAIGWKAGRRNGSLLTAFLVGLVTACTVGATALPLAGLVNDHAGVIAYGKVGFGGPTKSEADAASWLRKNSQVGDLVATDAHCVLQKGDLCDSRHFWIAALSERQLLVEGWAYTNRANRMGITTGENPNTLPFWNRELLAANNAAFSTPSAAVIERLRRYGVRYLYDDTRGQSAPSNLKQYVRLRYATLDATIYEIS
jgi:hypothetical protein